MKRLVCDVLREMRNLREQIILIVSNKTPYNGVKTKLEKWGKLIEEAQDMVNRMEYRIGEYHDFIIETKEQVEGILNETDDILEKKGKYERKH